MPPSGDPPFKRTSMIKGSFCQKCGREIEGPGICAGCAEVTTEVAFPVLVRQVIKRARKTQSLALARIRVADELFHWTPRAGQLDHPISASPSFVDRELQTQSDERCAVARLTKELADATSPNQVHGRTGIYGR